MPVCLSVPLSGLADMPRPPPPPRHLLYPPLRCMKTLSFNFSAKCLHMSCPLVLQLLYHDMTSDPPPAPCHAHGRANYFVMNFDISAKERKKRKRRKLTAVFLVIIARQTKKNWLKNNIPGAECGCKRGPPPLPNFNCNCKLPL